MKSKIIAAALGLTLAAALAGPAAAKPGTGPKVKPGKNEPPAVTTDASTPTTAGATSTTASAGGSSTTTAPAAATGKGKAEKAQRAPAKPVKPVKVQVVGILRSAGAGTITISVKGGNAKSVKGTDVTVKLSPDARVTRNGRPAKPADLKAGDHVEASGADGVVTKLHAQGKKVPTGSGGGATTTTAPTSGSTTSTTVSSTTSTTAAIGATTTTKAP